MSILYLAVIFSLLRGGTSGILDDEGWENGEFFFRLFPSADESNRLEKEDGDKRLVHFRMYERLSSSLKRSSSNPKSYLPFKVIDSLKMNTIPDGMDTSLPTMVIVAGFMTNVNATFTTDLISVARRVGRWNIFLMDWHKLAAGPWYPWAQGNVKAVGRYLAIFLDSLAEAYQKTSKRSLSSFFENLHVIGFSLGAHVAGVAGKHVTKGRIARITGLDPAYPLIERLETDSHHLDSSDADFVDVIHTCGGYMGIPHSVGHADFFPNGGNPPQPGCEETFLLVGCSHRHAWRYFTESLIDSEAFEALPCTNWADYDRGMCSRNRKNATYMGISANTKARGNYYLRTHPPYQ